MRLRMQGFGTGGSTLRRNSKGIVYIGGRAGMSSVVVSQFDKEIMRFYWLTVLLFCLLGISSA